MIKNAVKDPVCGMDVESTATTIHAEYKGHTYYFCGAPCKVKFDLKPEQYVAKAAEKPKSAPAPAAKF